MQKQWIAMAVGMMLLTGCDRNEKVPQTTASPLKEAREVTGETTSFGTPVVSVSLRDGRLVSVSIDEITGDTTKKTLGDQYLMSDQSIAPWSQQIEALERFLLTYGPDAVTVDENGKATNEDLRSQCTISIDNYLSTVKEAIRQAESSKES